MKTLTKTLGFAAVLSFAFLGQIRAQDAPPAPQNVPAQQNADDGISFQTFYDNLASQGTWINTDKYGYVFQPTETNKDWRPYTYGHWVQTQQGMTWVSDDSFGWATDHYGRWTNIDGYGWVWVPGYTWAPAWVSWRQSDDDVGWAPLPPSSDEGIDYYNDDDYYTDADYGYHIGDDCDLAFGIGPWWYNFCPVAYIGDRDCWRHFRDRRDNFAFIHHTRNVTNINFRRNGEGRFDHVRAEGPNVAALNARAHTPIAHAELTAATRRSEAGLHGNSLAVFAPRISPATAHTARPTSVAATVARTNVNYGTDINREPAVNSRVTPDRATAAQVRTAKTAQGDTVHNNAQVASTATRATRSLNQPLTSLHTSTRTTRSFDARSDAEINRGGASSADARFTGEPATRRGTVSAAVDNESRFTGENAQRHVFQPRPEFAPNQSSAFRSSAPAFRESTPSFRSSAPVYHNSAPSYHPQTTFRSFSPAPAQHFSAPAAHFSGGGGFSGGGRSFGGGGGVSRGGGGGGSGGGRGGGGGGGRR